LDLLMKDDAAHLDTNTVYDWALIATQFIAEYLDLKIDSAGPSSEERDTLDDRKLKGR
jgi:hypothetical protein